MSYRTLGLPIPTTFYEKQQPRYFDNNQYDYPPQSGGEFGRDILLGSPGGLASTAHHWTGGFYGKGGSSTDKFIGKHSDPFPSGEFGPLYSEKENEQLNDAFEILPYKDLQLSEESSGDCKDGTCSLKKSIKETTQISYGGKTVSFWWAVGFALLLMSIYFVLNLWTTTGMLYLKDYVGKGKDFGPKSMLFLSAAGTMFLILLSWLLGTSFLSILEQASA